MSLFWRKSTGRSILHDRLFGLMLLRSHVWTRSNRGNVPGSSSPNEIEELEPRSSAATESGDFEPARVPAGLDIRVLFVIPEPDTSRR
jgi:hypothetical protein